jgi:succinate-semialdehyde dehydrogenase/glutarate-semialdehyde dehydrogenase
LITHAIPQAPWGGLKKSGFGRSHSHFGLLDLVNIKHINLDSCGGPHRLWWHPYGPSRVATARGGLKFLHSGIVGKPMGLLSFLGNMWLRPKKSPDKHST